MQVVHVKKLLIIPRVLLITFNPFRHFLLLGVYWNKKN